MHGSRSDCAWCGGDLRSGERQPGLVRCPSCGVATTDPWPTDDDLERAYGDWYRPEDGRFSGFGDAVLRRTRAHVAARLDRIAPPGRVLDVGAGDGTLVDMLSSRGREALGIERTSSRPGIRTGDVGDEPAGDWAAVVFWHSLEHLPNPREALENAAARLRPGGVLVVVVPNSASLQARVFGARWLALDLPRHLVHLTSRALLEELRRLGLEIDRVSYLRGGQSMFGWLHGLVACLPGHPSLYDAVRRPAARSRPLSPVVRVVTLIAAIILIPVAVVASLLEIALRMAGTVYVEARRP